MDRNNKKNDYSNKESDVKDLKKDEFEKSTSGTDQKESVNSTVGPVTSESTTDSRSDSTFKPDVRTGDQGDAIDKWRNGKGKKFSTKSNNERGNSGSNTNKSSNNRVNAKNSDNATSSVVSKTKVNTLSNFDSGLARSRLETSGWIERTGGDSIFDLINATWADLGINAKITLDRRGEYLRTFGNWIQLQSARPNNSTDVYVLDDANSDKSISSERIFDNLYRQRRPFSAMANGVPVVNAQVLPDIISNVKFLQFSTNSHTDGLTPDSTFGITYGRLEQVLNSNSAYGDRSVRLVNNSDEHAHTPGIVQGFRIPSDNDNGIGIPNYPANNHLESYSIDLTPDNDRQLPGGLNISIELNNKSKTLTKLFRILREEAANYSKKASSGDNMWFSPATLLADEASLAATINGAADLKTFLFIMNDAIEGAFRSQMIKAMKVGTPDSNYAALVERSTYIKTEYSTQFGKIWSKLKNFPMHKDIIDKWNQFKKWSKFKQDDYTKRDNPLLIPYFLVTRSGGFNYTDVSGGTRANSHGEIASIHPTLRELENLLTFTAQTLDRSRVIIPQGDWFSLFVQDVIGSMSLDSFIRTGASNVKFPFGSSNRGETTANNNGPFHTATAMINAEQIITNGIQDMTRLQNNRTDRGLSITPPTASVTFGHDNANTHGLLLPLTHDYVDSKMTNKMIDTKYGGKVNTFGDLLICYHTMTGFMAGFMEIITSQSNFNLLQKWVTIFEEVEPYFARLADICPKGEAFMFGDSINYVSIVTPPAMFGEAPTYNREQNIDFFYETQFTETSYNFSYQPTRVNYVTPEDWDLYQDEPYKLAGIRWTMINQNGTADRDISADNTLCTIQGTGNTHNAWGQTILNHNVYLASHSVIRFSRYISVNANRGSANSLFPIYIGEHLGSMFFNNVNVATNGDVQVPVGQLTSRSLVVNSTDGVLMSSYIGFMDQLINTQLMHNIDKYNADTNVLIPNTPYVDDTLITLANVNYNYVKRVMFEYKNNSSTIIIDQVIQKVFQRWDINDSYVLTTTFSNL